MTPNNRQRTPSIRDAKTKSKHQQLVIYNSLTKQKEAFLPLDLDAVRMYTCGLTVNNLMHIGHARCYIFWDVVERYLRYLGYHVIHISNVTDISVDHRILNRIRDTGESFQQLVTRHTQDYFEDRRRLGVADPHTYTLATQHIHEMIELVQQLLERGHAYVADDGVYFRISTYPQYGRLSGIRPKALKTGASGRIDQDEYDKESAGDFVLWKQARPGEPYWHSPWGPGRPGWHIECSAMSMKYLGESFDISGGGEDNIFPHHENTIAQSESVTGKPYVQFWMHVRHLMLQGEKMSKSTGNFLATREACAKYSAAVVRLFLLSTHYRKPLDFNESDLARTEQKLKRLQQVIALLDFTLQSEKPVQSKANELIEALEHVEHQFRQAMNDDFNTALALNHIFRFISQIQRHVHSTTRIDHLQAAEVLTFLRRIGTILFGDLYDQEIVPPKASIVSQLVNLLLREREFLRQNRQYKRGDAIRAALHELGIEVADNAKGFIWWRTHNHQS